MEGIVKEVFVICGVLIVSCIVFGALFGPVGRSMEWNASEDILINAWKTYMMIEDSPASGESDYMRTNAWEATWADMNALGDVDDD